MTVTYLEFILSLIQNKEESSGTGGLKIRKEVRMKKREERGEKLRDRKKRELDGRD